MLSLRHMFLNVALTNDFCATETHTGPENRKKQEVLCSDSAILPVSERTCTDGAFSLNPWENFEAEVLTHCVN